MSRSYAPLLASLVILSTPATAFADCPSSLTLQKRIDCLNTALNAAATTITALQTTNTELEASNAELVARLDAVEDDVANISADYLVNGDLDDYATVDYVDSLFGSGTDGIPNLSDYLSVDTVTDSIIFTGANVYVQSGSGSTYGTVNGLGNLIVGYNEDRIDVGLPPADRTGSHNLVVGIGHSYTSFGSFVAGSVNTVSAAWSSVSGGQGNEASYYASSVSGGESNIASGWASSVSGGYGNEAGDWATVSGGDSNFAGGARSSILGGVNNATKGQLSSVCGGRENEASGEGASVSGGGGNIAGGLYSSVLGGSGVTVTSDYGHSP